MAFGSGKSAFRASPNQVSNWEKGLSDVLAMSSSRNEYSLRKSAKAVETGVVKAVFFLGRMVFYKKKATFVGLRTQNYHFFNVRNSSGAAPTTFLLFL
jgi:hypothetical protein